MDEPGPQQFSYADDVYGWAGRQAALLREGRFTDVDVDNVTEEIESLGRSQASGLQSSYRLIATRLLKVLFQPERMTRSCQVTILRERLNAEDCLASNQSLKLRRDDIFGRAYAQARKLAATETGLPVTTFPIEPAFGLDQIGSEDYASWTALPQGSV